jgi:ribose transport system ATP-binding protein
MTAHLLQTTAIAKAYGPVIALRAVDLAVAPGEIHALLGANGAGKSTVVKILTGVIGFDSGDILINGTSTAFRGPAAARAARVASVFQDPALVGDLTVAQNLTLTGADAGAVHRELVDMDLGGLDFSEQVRDIPLPFLRMIDLARALASDPTLLLLDEITAALPPDLSDRVFGVMDALKARGRSVLFISHRLAEVGAHCDVCTVLRDGSDVDTFAATAGESRMVSAMLGESSAHVRDQARRTGERSAVDHDSVPRLVARNLAGGRQLHDVSLEVHAGEVLGLAALEGQGQDLLFQMLSGDRRPDSGEILVDGKPLNARHPFDAIRRGVVLVPSDRMLALLPQRSIRENLASPLYNRISAWGKIPWPSETEAVNRAVDQLSIDTRAASAASQLSGGNQQKLTIGRWLTGGFRTLLLFDPTRGIDIGTKHQIYDLIRKLADEGAAVVMFTSELREIGLVCDRAVVLHDGEVVAELPPDAGESALLTAAHGLAVAR